MENVCVYIYACYIVRYNTYTKYFHQLLNANYLPDFQEEQMNRCMRTIKKKKN